MKVQQLPADHLPTQGPALSLGEPEIIVVQGIGAVPSFKLATPAPTQPASQDHTYTIGWRGAGWEVLFPAA